jgi:regulatory protein
VTHATTSPYVLALTWLGVRELTRHQLRTRLLRRGHEPAEVDASLDRLAAEGRLDDRRAAEAIVRRHVGVKGRGPARLGQELAAAGVEDGLRRAVMREAFDGVDEAPLVERALRRHLAGRRRPPDRRRVYAALVRQGFTPAIVREVLREHLPASPPGRPGDEGEP